MTLIHARLGLQQRVLPEYRAPFFDQLAGACLHGLSVFAGTPRRDESIEMADSLRFSRLEKARNLHLFHGKAYLCWQLGILPWLQTWNPDVLVVEANARYLSTYPAMRWMHLHHRPVIGWGLGTGSSSGIESLLRKHFLHQLDAVIAYSREGAKQYIAAGFNPGRVFVAPNAVTPRPQDAPPDRPKGFRNGRASLLFVGRLQARKRVDRLIRACALLPMVTRPDLIIVGDGPERQALESLARRTYPQTRFTGALTGKSLDPIYAQADLFVLPGTGGLAVQQAMAQALPVVVGEADGTQAELVRHGNGWLLQDASDEALGITLGIALKDAVNLRQMGRESYRIVSEEVNTDEMVKAFGQAVERVLRNGKRSRK
jgi:glycosyltransferase involved in cell wall biosynthesis